MVEMVWMAVLVIPDGLSEEVTPEFRRSQPCEGLGEGVQGSRKHTDKCVWSWNEV